MPMYLHYRQPQAQCNGPLQGTSIDDGSLNISNATFTNMYPNVFSCICLSEPQLSKASLPQHKKAFSPKN